VIVGITEILELESGSNVAKRHYLWRATFEHEVILMTAAQLYVEEAFSFYKQFIRE
jgi:hypothetical protein